MLLKIVHYGDKVLREKARPVPAVTPELVKLAEDMVETMYKARGVGLAAEQVGRLESVCVIDVPGSCEEDDETRAFNAAVKMPLVMFNPVVISTEGSQSGREGCLSFPRLGGTVVRPGQVTCQYTDLRGMPQIITARGFLARAVMHETDHLNGVLYVDRMSAAEKLEMADKLRRMAQKNGGSM
ncbi:MAG: peptide deformylase [Kiritimatiellae bacterium]|nr:peptide deformylase [Kiritimatiellia bacterium]